MPRPDEAARPSNTPAKIVPCIICFATALVYYFSNPKPQFYYDYTFRVAANILGGSIAFTEKQPSWLNEFVPFEGFYFSVFPLGSVLSMLPFALFKALGFINDMPAALIAALCAGVMVVFLNLVSKRYEFSEQRRWLMIIGMMFGTFTWTNLTMAGAWQLALGFAMAAELGAIYFTVYDRRPLIAGLFFAIGFGNRTEILLTAPIFFYLLMSEPPASAGGQALNSNPRKVNSRSAKTNSSPAVNASASYSRLSVSAVNFRAVAAFCVAPFVLGIATLFYNYIRFHSFADFGYARIPGVLDEPWYNHGIFSFRYIPGQIWEMLWRPWEIRGVFPYIVPNGFSSSILWSSPFLLFAFRSGARDLAFQYASWLAILVLCVLLWMHGNSGGWQFGYRYAMVCLPWLFVILLETSPKKITPFEWAAYIFSFAANLYATWLFHWTDYLKP